jgi:hypothetical protein
LQALIITPNFLFRFSPIIHLVIETAYESMELKTKLGRFHEHVITIELIKGANESWLRNYPPVTPQPPTLSLNTLQGVGA